MIRRSFVFLGAVVMLVGATAAYAFPPIDLTTSGTSVLGADGAFWKQNVTQPTGTGVYDPFNRIRAHGSEEGLNSDAGGVLDNLAEAASQNWNHSLKFGNLAVTVVNLGNGLQGYYRFTLDINEPNNDPNWFISLDKVRMYTVAGTGGTATTEADITGAGGTLRYDMDATTDQTVFLNHNITEGSGHDDMELFVPASYFAGALATDFFYLYSSFGNSGGLFDGVASGDGFEEWAVDVAPGTEVPEPGSLALIGFGVLGLAGVLRRKKS